MRSTANSGIIKGSIDSSYRACARDDAYVGAIEEQNLESGADGTRHTFAYGQYRVAYEVHGSGDRVLVWMHGLLLDANLSRHLARRLAAQGNRVVLLDLLGHGRSDRPRHAGALRMDLYAEQVLRLLDELGVDQAVLGGVSLGTNVSLLTAVAAPERVRGLVLEMPVLELAVPAAVGVFMPVLILAHWPPRGAIAVSGRRRAPPSGIGALDSFVSAVASDSDETAAALHGVLIGPIAPTSDQRRAITAPALVLGHGIDLIHSFADAERLTRQLPNARLIRTGRSPNSGCCQAGPPEKSARSSTESGGRGTGSGRALQWRWAIIPVSCVVSSECRPGRSENGRPPRASRGITGSSP